MIEIPWMIVVILFIADLLHGGIKTSQERKADNSKEKRKQAFEYRVRH